MSNEKIDRALAAALENPEAALEAMDRLEAERRLVGFIQYMWEVLEPGRDFVNGWAIGAICEHLEAVSNGEIRRLLINVPPGCMKSMTTCVFWPAWEWGPKNRPQLRYVSSSYSEELTIRDNRRCRILIESERYQAAWGDRFHLTADQNAKVRYDNDHMGVRIATSVGGMTVGERGDRFTIDDPHNIKTADSEARREDAAQWFTEVVPTRLNDPDRSAIVVIMQRVHTNDISGLILKHDLGYTHLCLPMEFEQDRKCKTIIGFEDPRTEEGELLWPQFFSRNYLENELKPQMRAWGGTYAEAGQLQQRPVPRGGGMFKREFFQFVDSAPADAVRVVRGWDLAGSVKKRAKFTAGVKMSRDSRGRIYIEHSRRLKGSPHAVEQAVVACATADGLDVKIGLPQDPGQAGKSQKGHLAALVHGYNVRFTPETGSKEDRARPLAAQAEAGNLFLVRGSWNETFIQEAMLFPAGEYTDQIDAASRAYMELQVKKRTPLGSSPEIIGG